MQWIDNITSIRLVGHGAVQRIYRRRVGIVSNGYHMNECRHGLTRQLVPLTAGPRLVERRRDAAVTGEDGRRWRTDGLRPLLAASPLMNANKTLFITRRCDPASPRPSTVPSLPNLQLRATVPAG